MRATYFVITTDAPTPVWQVELPPLAGIHGLRALGVLGVVYGALRDPPGDLPGSGRPEFFVDVGDIEAIFSLEDTDSLSVQLEDIWLPLMWCLGAPFGEGGETTTDDLARGDVLRVALEVFRQAYRYTAGDLTLDQLLATDATGSIFASPEETLALQRWAELQIEQTRRAFPDKEVKLRYREE